MSVNLRLDNYSDNNILDNTTLNADSAAAATSLTVVDSSGFTANDFVLVGGKGIEGSEKAQLSAISNSTTVTVSALSLPHNRFDPMYKLFGDKIKVYRAANVNGTLPADISFASIATISPDFGENTTVYNDSSGGNNYWYKYTYYNSLTLGETDLADSEAERGAGYNTYCAIDEIRDEAGLQNNAFITDAMIDAKRYEAQYEIDAELEGLYVVPFQSPINPVIRGITIKLAAGKLLSRDYGPMSSGNSKSGTDKITQARAELTRLDNKQLVLTDVQGSEIAVSGVGGVSGYPDDNTDTDLLDDGGSFRSFRKGYRF